MNQELKLFLRSDVFTCVTKNYWVFLDAKHDKYFCVDRPNFDALLPYFTGWLSAGVSTWPKCGRMNANSSAFASELVALGLITKDPNHASPETQINDPHLRVELTSPPTRSFLQWTSALRYAPAFLLAAQRADRALRKESFAVIVRNVRARSMISSQTIRPSFGQPIERLVQTFMTLRPLSSRSYLCMFDSLALIEFLSLFSVFPNWIFGVKTDPFYAHCWVQYDNVILNDTVEAVAQYTPIMSI
jgi:hypothetical protein